MHWNVMTDATAPRPIIIGATKLTFTIVSPVTGAPSNCTKQTDDANWITNERTKSTRATIANIFDLLSSFFIKKKYANTAIMINVTHKKIVATNVNDPTTAQPLLINPISGE